MQIQKVGTTGGRTTTTNPFYFTSLVASSTGDQYKVWISPTTVGNYVLKGYTWEDGSVTGWNPQTTNFHTGSAVTFTLKSSHAIHMRWIYKYVAPAPTPTPTPAPPPAPTPKPTPKPTVKPAATPKPVSAAATPAPGLGGQLPAAPSSGAPSVPGSFQALVDGSNAIVNLSWAASADGIAVASYHLERSLEQTNWTRVGGDITALSFSDDTVAFGIHYYYRLAAVGQSGAVSGYAFAEAKTGDFSANSDSGSDGTYVSDDQVVTVVVPAGGTTSDSAVCTVAKATSKFGSNDRPVVAGPYMLVCKTAGGDLITDFSKPVAWTFSLKDKLKGYSNPSVVSSDSNGGESEVKGAVYDSKTKTMKFSQTGASTTAVLASAARGLSASLVVMVLAALLLIAGVFAVVLRRNQRQSYNDYLRQKYYNL